MLSVGSIYLQRRGVVDLHFSSQKESSAFPVWLFYINALALITRPPDGVAASSLLGARLASLVER